jgi:uncharacterized protein YbaR (Trm112 family)
MTDSPHEAPAGLDSRLLEILRCPACRGEFAPPGEQPPELVCTSCGLHYPVRNGVPVLLVDEATRG